MEGLRDCLYTGDGMVQELGRIMYYLSYSKLLESADRKQHCEFIAFVTLNCIKY